MTRHAFRLSGGATLLAANRTHFRLWAPDRRAVGLELDGRPAVPMQPSADGWFEVEAAVGAGAGYRFLLEQNLSVPDPMSRAQGADIHDVSLIVDPADYVWQQPDWHGRAWTDTVIYELHVGLCGGFKGVAALLPALKELGITAVELMPVADFPGPRNWGYDGVLPFAPDRSYGSPRDLKALVDRVHDLGMMIFLDVVYNHFGPDGNYLGLYASGFFRADKVTPWGAAIDFRQPVVQQYFIENALYWLEEYQFDGLRLDAAQAITSQDWLSELAKEVRSYFPDRSIHLMLEHDGNVAALLEQDYAAQWNDDIHHALHVLLTEEVSGYYGDYASSPIDMLARCLQEGFAYQGEISAHRGGISRGTSSKDLSPDHFIFFLQNHDQIGNRAFGERLASLANVESFKVAIALQLLSPQIPLLFMGEEIGSQQPFLYFTSHNAELAEAVRQGRRREFAQFPAFGASDALDRLPDPNASETFDRSRMAVEPEYADAWRQFYHHLLSIRGRMITPRLPGCRALNATVLSAHALMAEWLLGDGQILTLACNFDGPTATMPVLLQIDTPIYVLNRPDTVKSRTELPPNSLIAWIHSADAA
jgi:malto-oligosyltrehalose trehalohydrolase